jgi:hypothetical protein
MSDLDEITRILRMPRVHQMMQRRYDVNSRSYDVPGVAGYSADWTKHPAIYLDRGLRPWNFPTPAATSAVPRANMFLILRAQIEKALLDSGEFSRLECRSAAYCAEENAVAIQHGGDGLISYREFIRREGERLDTTLPKLPPDLQFFTSDPGVPHG